MARPKEMRNLVGGKMKFPDDIQLWDHILVKSAMDLYRREDGKIYRILVNGYFYKQVYDLDHALEIFKNKIYKVREYGY